MGDISNDVRTGESKMLPRSCTYRQILQENAISLLQFHNPTLGAKEDMGNKHPPEEHPVLIRISLSLGKFDAVF